MSETRQAVMKFLSELCPNEELRRALAEETELMEAGILDSFGVVRLIQFVEDEFHIRIPDSDIGPTLFASGAAIIAYIERQNSATQAPAAAVAARV